MVVVEGGPIWLYILGRFVEIGLVVFFTVIWLLNMQRALDECVYTERKIQPAQVWLTFIPLFGLVWQYIAVTKVSETLAQEYKVRGWISDEDRPAIETGIVACTVVLIVLIVRLSIPDLHPALGFFSSLGICLCMFMHRDRVKAFTERLENENRKAQSAPAFSNLQGSYPQPQFPTVFDFPPQPNPYQPYQQPQFPPAYNYPPPPLSPLPNPYAPPNPYQPPVNPPQGEQFPPQEWNDANRWGPPQQ